MSPVTETEGPGIVEAFEALMAEARQRIEQLAECHALLLRLSEEKELFNCRPVTGAVKLAARALLQRHGILAAEDV